MHFAQHPLKTSSKIEQRLFRAWKPNELDTKRQAGRGFGSWDNHYGDPEQLPGTVEIGRARSCGEIRRGARCRWSVDDAIFAWKPLGGGLGAPRSSECLLVAALLAGVPVDQRIMKLGAERACVRRKCGGHGLGSVKTHDGAMIVSGGLYVV